MFQEIPCLIKMIDAAALVIVMLQLCIGLVQSSFPMEGMPDYCIYQVKLYATEMSTVELLSYVT